MGRIVAVNESPCDKQVRSADILTTSGRVLQRSISQLYPLEVNGPVDDEVKATSDAKPQDIDSREGVNRGAESAAVEGRPRRAAADAAIAKIIQHNLLP